MRAAKKKNPIKELSTLRFHCINCGIRYFAICHADLSSRFIYIQSERHYLQMLGFLNSEFNKITRLRGICLNSRGESAKEQTKKGNIEVWFYLLGDKWKLSFNIYKLV